jgi:hypothetical protein
VLPEIVQTALCLFDGWDVSRRNPPQDKVGAFDVLKELLPPPEDGRVIRVVVYWNKESRSSQTLKLIRIIGSPRTRMDVELPSSAW